MALSLLFATAALGVCIVAAFMYIIIMGPSRYHRDGVVGGAYRTLTVLPVYCGGACLSVLCCCSLHDGQLRWRRCTRHVLHERNWLMVAFYIVLVGTAEVLYLAVALPRLQASFASKLLSWALVVASEVCYTLAVFSDPGTVTPLHARGTTTTTSAAVAAVETSAAASSRAAASCASRGKHHDDHHHHHRHHLPRQQQQTRRDAARRDVDDARTRVPRSTAALHRPASAAEEALNTRYVVDGMLYSLCAEAEARLRVRRGNGNDEAATRREHDHHRHNHHPHDNDDSDDSDNDDDDDGSSSRHCDNVDDGVSASVCASRRGNDDVVAAATARQCGVECRTCHVPRPSRSKHCALCDRCVRRFDHHCPWINNDVAEGTQRYFLAFLLLHALSCTWACIDLLRSLRQFLLRANAWGWRVRLYNGRTLALSFFDYVVICANLQTLNACLLFFAACIGVVLYCFWAYEMSYAVTNLTMNDMNKIDCVVRYIEEQPTVMHMYAEAMRIRARLADVAERKPLALCSLARPPATLVPARRAQADLSGDAARTALHAEGTTATQAKRGALEVCTSVLDRLLQRRATADQRAAQAYRKRVAAAVAADLRGLFDRGWWRNLSEVFLPYTM